MSLQTADDLPNFLLHFFHSSVITPALRSILSSSRDSLSAYSRVIRQIANTAKLTCLFLSICEPTAAVAPRSRKYNEEMPRDG